MKENRVMRGKNDLFLWLSIGAVEGAARHLLPSLNFWKKSKLKKREIYQKLKIF
jgi:hypothetical protein